MLPELALTDSVRGQHLRSQLLDEAMVLSGYRELKGFPCGFGGNSFSEELSIALSFRAVE
jgi:hypothetical protein